MRFIKNILLGSIAILAFSIGILFQQASAAEITLALQNDLGQPVEVIHHSICGDRPVPTIDDCIYGGTGNNENENGLRVRYTTDSESSDTGFFTLLSYRNDGKLYQRLIPPLTQSTVIKLSSFIERDDDHYCFGNAHDIDYNDAYCNQLAEKIQNLVANQTVIDSSRCNTTKSARR